MPTLVIADGTGSSESVIIPCASVDADASRAGCDAMMRDDTVDPDVWRDRWVCAAGVARDDLLAALRSLADAEAPLDAATVASLRDSVVVDGRPGVDALAWCGPGSDEVALFACTRCEASLCCLVVMASKKRILVISRDEMTVLACDAYTRRGLAICAREVLEELEEEPWEHEGGTMAEHTSECGRTRATESDGRVTITVPVLRSRDYIYRTDLLLEHEVTVDALDGLLDLFPRRPRGVLLGAEHHQADGYTVIIATEPLLGCVLAVAPSQMEPGYAWLRVYSGGATVECRDGTAQISVSCGSVTALKDALFRAHQYARMGSGAAADGC